MFVIVECVVFGIFVFAIICEQINSITSSTHAQIVQINQADNLILHSDPSSSVYKIKVLIKNFKHNTYFNYAQFRRVFKSDNPIFWLFPLEIEKYIYNKLKFKLDQQQTQCYDA